MDEDKKFERLASRRIERYLKGFGGVVITGPRFVGKTTLATRFAQTILKLTKDNDFQRVMADFPNILNEEAKPILIDDWQLVKSTFLEVKNFVDETRMRGVAIFTGSINPILKGRFAEPAAGRFARVKLTSLSSWESDDSEGLVSLSELIDNNQFQTKSLKRPLDLRKLIKLICRGGLPLAVLNPDDAYEINHQYIDDIFAFATTKDQLNFKPRTMKAILKFCALNPGTNLKWTGINKLMPVEEQISLPTIYKYKDLLLNNLLVIEQLEAYFANFPSKKRLVATPKQYFFDPAIAVACARFSPTKFENNLNSLGLYFENLVYRDLWVYADSLGASLSHYRDSNGNEVDFILEMPSGEIAAIEVKTGINLEVAIQKASESLVWYKKNCLSEQEQARKWNASNNHVSSKLIIITGLGVVAYQHHFAGETIFVVPITALKP